MTDKQSRIDSRNAMPPSSQTIVSAPGHISGEIRYRRQVVYGGNSCVWRLQPRCETWFKNRSSNDTQYTNAKFKPPIEDADGGELRAQHYRRPWLSFAFSVNPEALTSSWDRLGEKP